MYAYISGTVASSKGDTVILDHQGIGYRILVPSGLAYSLQPGDEIKLYTHFSVREDALLLYGFQTEDDLALFRLLIGISGIGPKGALGILSVLDGDSLRFAVFSDDADALSKAPGIGRKTAKKVILELKDKLDMPDEFPGGKAESPEEPHDSAPRADAIMALVSLGYTNAESVAAVRGALKENPDADAEELIRLALRQMM